MTVLSAPRRHTGPAVARLSPRSSLSLAALGVVFGDIGTSPIYTIATVFNPHDPHPIASTRANVLGVASLIFWALTLVVTVRYVGLIMRADNDGEGGIMALITLVRRGRAAGGRRVTMLLSALGVLGASLFFGDSMITPAISVLSAVEGLNVIQPSLHELVLPITAGVIVALFASQRLGSTRVGSLFGPVMAVWFVAIAGCGLNAIRSEPQVLRALLPTYAFGFLAGHFATAFYALAAVVLAITGVEALYADLGHFGRAAITRAWLGLVFPACVLSYLGQAALVLHASAGAVASPFFLLAPSWGRMPMVALATAATIIAAQAVITGAFSLTHQAVQLGYLPRLRIHHTSARTYGQVYVPWVNWTLMGAVLTLVFAFRSSTALAFAFGMAVTLTITITTLLYWYLARARFHRPLWMVLGGAGCFLASDLLFVSANLTKFAHGAWLPLLIAGTVYTVMSTWQRGRAIVDRRRRAAEGPLQAFIDDLHHGKLTPVRVPGTAVFLNRGKATTPLALRANVEHNHVLHDQVVILSIETEVAPYLRGDQRIVIDNLGYHDGITHVTARFGYMETPNVPAIVKHLARQATEGRPDIRHASYFLSTVSLATGERPELPRWRQRLFLATSRLTADAAEYFQLPRNRTVIIGSRLEV